MNKFLAQAKPTIDLGATQPGGVGRNTEVSAVIQSIIQIIFVIGALGVLAYFVWGAIDWIFSGGDKEKIASARKKIMTAVIGLALLALTFLFLEILSKIFNFHVFGPFNIKSLDQKDTNI